MYANIRVPPPPPPLVMLWSIFFTTNIPLFVDLLDDLSLTQLVTRPTRGNNTLDFVIANNPNLVTACRVIPGVSDHDAVLTKLNIEPLRNKQTPRKTLLYKKADWEGLKKHISEFGRSLQSNFNFSTPVNQLWDNITCELERAINKFISHKTAKIKDRQPWINIKIRRLMRKRDKLYCKINTSPLQKNHVNSNLWNILFWAKVGRPIWTMWKTWLHLKKKTLLMKISPSGKNSILSSNIRKLIPQVLKHWRKMDPLLQTQNKRLISWIATSSLSSPSKYPWNYLPSANISQIFSQTMKMTCQKSR